MAKKKTKQKLEEKEQQLQLVEAKTRDLETQYRETLDKDPKYSLEVDPTNMYSMSDSQKEFIKHYVEFKNVNTAAELAGIDQNVAKQYFIAYSSQQEIRRINLALYHRQFSSKMLNLDEIGGYLTSLLTGENVPIGDQLKTSDKLRVVQMLIDLNTLKQNAYDDPRILMAKDIDIQIKNLSVSTIAALLAQSKEKPKIFEVSDFENEESSLTPEESAYLSTLPTDQLLQLLEDTNKGGEDNVNK